MTYIYIYFLNTNVCIYFKSNKNFIMLQNILSYKKRFLYYSANVNIYVCKKDAQVSYFILKSDKFIF